MISPISVAYAGPNCSSAEEQFGPAYATDIGDIIRKYSQLVARRKPELLSAETYSLLNYNEAIKVQAEYKDLLFIAEKTDAELPSEYKDAYYELVLHPVRALANLNELYFWVALNRQAGSHGQSGDNNSATKARQAFVKDSLITLQYHAVANGKWNHMMDQTHIGYTYWQQPPVNKMPEVKYAKADSAKTSTVFAENITLTSTEAAPITKLKSNVFQEKDQYISIEAAHWTRAVSSQNIKWKIIPDIGKTNSGVSTFPVTASSALNSNGPHLQYEFYSYDSGNAKINLYFSPTLNFHNDEGLQYAVSIDDEQPQIFSLNKDDANVRVWESWVASNIIIKSSQHNIHKAGKHILKYWMISPAIVLQKLVVDFGGVKPSYLGPPETRLVNGH